MKRPLFITFSTLSLLLCVATAGLWIRSQWFASYWGCYDISADSTLTLFSCAGRLGISDGYIVAEKPVSGWVEERAEAVEPRAWVCLGFYASISPVWGIEVPDWFVVAVTAVLPCLWLRAYRRSRRARLRGLCLICGYDLTGNMSGICPECGAPIPAAQSPPKDGIAAAAT